MQRDQTDQKAAMMQAYATGCYSMKEIASAFNAYYATVSRVINKKRYGNL